MRKSDLVIKNLFVIFVSGKLENSRKLVQAADKCIRSEFYEEVTKEEKVQISSFLSPPYFLYSPSSAEILFLTVYTYSKL
jgi:hypothetical protein